MATYPTTPGTWLNRSLMTTVGGMLSPSAYTPQFDPSTVSGIQIWLKADSLSLNDGDAVSTWTDSSTNGNDFTGTTTTRPIYKTGIVNGKPILRFDGTDDILTATSSATYRTIFAVGKYTAGATFVDYNGLIANASTHMINGYAATTNIVTGVASMTAAWRNGQARTTADVYGNVGFDFYPINSEFWCGTFQLASNTTMTALLGRTAGAGRFWGGDIAEVLAYNAVLSSTDRANIETYLVNKYALTSSYNPRTQNAYRFEGDSLTYGTGATTSTGSWPSQLLIALGRHLDFSVFAVAGSAISGMVSRAATTDASYSATYARNILFAWCGTNDMGTSVNHDAATTYADLVAYCTARKAAGWTVAVFTILPRSDGGAGGSFEARRTTFNSSMRTDFNVATSDSRVWLPAVSTTYADVLVDVAADGRIGDSGDENDTTYYSADKVHLNNTGYGVITEVAGVALTKI